MSTIDVYFRSNEPDKAVQILPELSLKKITKYFTELMDKTREASVRVQYLERFVIAISAKQSKSLLKKPYLLKAQRALDSQGAKYRDDFHMRVACRGGHLNIMKLFHQCGIGLNVVTQESEFSLLHYAAENGRTDVAEWLLEEKAHVDPKCKPFRRTPMHYACLYGYGRIANVLIKGGAKMNEQDVGGCTPLHLACSEVKEYKTDRALAGRLAFFLISKGADPTIGDIKGHRAIDYISDEDLDKAVATKKNAEETFLSKIIPKDVQGIIFRKIENLWKYRRVCREWYNLIHADLRSKLI